MCVGGRVQARSCVPAYVPAFVSECVCGGGGGGGGVEWGDIARY